MIFVHFPWTKYADGTPNSIGRGVAWLVKLPHILLSRSLEGLLNPIMQFYPRTANKHHVEDN